MSRVVRRPWLGLALVASLAAGSSTAQTSHRVSGYYEHQLTTSRTSDRWTLLDHDRFRVAFDATAGRRAKGSIAVIYQLFRGETRIPFRDLLPRALAEVADTFALELENRHFVNHLSVTLSPGPLEITAGKQYLTWGAAAVFNPTELFRPKNPYEPGYDREGVSGVSTKLALGPLSEVLVALVPNGGFETSGKVIRARHHLAGFDVSAMLAAVYESPAPATIPAPAADLERRLVLGGDFTGEVLGLGVWGEAAWSEQAGSRWVEATLGGNYTLADGTHLTLEGYYNGRGESGDPYSTRAWLARVLSGRRSVGKSLLYGQVSRQVDQLWTVGMSVLASPGDRSAALVPSAGYSFAENVDLLVNGIVAIGAEGTEYGTASHGAFLRARIYF